MPTVTDHIRKRLLQDVPERLPKNLRNTELNLVFRDLCTNRKILGAMRYGLFGAEGKPRFDRIAYIKEKLTEFEKTRNGECLVDIANACELEFTEGDTIWNPSDDGPVHAKTVE